MLSAKNVFVLTESRLQAWRLIFWKMNALEDTSLKLKKTLGDRAFSSAASNLWNNLPLHIRLEDNFERFKSLLKRMRIFLD